MLGCVIMAAGSASRFGGAKLLAKLDGKPLAAYAMDAVPDGIRTVVVTGNDAVAALAAMRGIPVVRNDRPEDGVSRTIRLGTEYLMRESALSGILYLVADQPLLRRESVQRIAEAFLQSPDRICSAAADGRRANPCLFPRDLLGELCALTGDCGGSRVIRANADRLRMIDLPPEELLDADTPEALRAIEAVLSRRAEA